MAVQFGKYQLLDRIAEGGMAEIFLARQVDPQGGDRPVVIKRVLPHLGNNTELMKMFLDEARISARLAHPNIVQIYDFGQEGNTFYLAMEYLAGEDMHSIVKASRAKTTQLPFPLAALVIGGACEGLQHAHAFVDEGGRPLGIVHRDVSPSNIFVTYAGGVKLLDFGIAKAEGKLAQTRAGVLKGKYCYMSPEQATSKVVDLRSDIFALGTVLYEVITNVRLFQRDNEVAILRAVTDEPILPPGKYRADLPSELEEIIMTALQRDPAKRFQTAAEMGKALAGFVDRLSPFPAPSFVADFLRGLVGQSRIQRRSNVPRSSTLAAPPPPPPPLPEPTVDDEITAPRSLVTEAPTGSRFRTVALALGMFMLSVLAGLGVVMAVRMSDPMVGETHLASASADAPPAAPDPPRFGLLRVECPGSCRLYLDDAEIPPPARGEIRVPEGRHRLKAINYRSGAVVERQVVIVAGAEARELIRF
jgi:serine/threonine-protein kinase